MCEDFPCCGHERGDCEGQLYGTDEQIKENEIRRQRDFDDFGYIADDDH